MVGYAPSQQLAKTLTEFYAAQKKPRLPCFRLLDKTHKSTCLNNRGGFASRPLVGLTRWGTTGTSILLAVIGNIFWKLDCLQDPMAAPLSDTVDLIQRLGKLGALSPSCVCTNCDVSALYTNIFWDNMICACNFWTNWSKNLLTTTMVHLTQEERELMDLFYSGSDVHTYLGFRDSFPFCDFDYDGELTVGRFLLNVIYRHSVFLNEGFGIYLQRLGWAMGTNAALTWATLALRAYELTTPLRLHSSLPPTPIFRFIDDICLVHKPVDKQRLMTALRQIYPENLNLTFECCMQRTGIPFLDLYIISLSPLRTAVYFKGTHSCTYIPWSANLPMATKTGWISGECVRYLTICREESFFLLAWRRLRAAQDFWGYPRRLWLPAPPVKWRHKCSVMTIKRHQISDEGNEGMGRFGLGLFSPRGFVLRAPHHRCIALSWSKIVSHISSCVPYLPGTRFFVTLKPSPNLKKIFNKFRSRALTQAAGTNL